MNKSCHFYGFRKNSLSKKRGVDALRRRKLLTQMLTSPFIDDHVDINTDRDDADRDDHTSSCSSINENNDQLDTESF